MFLGGLPSCFSVEGLQHGSSEGLKRFSLPQLFPDLTDEGSTDVVSFGRCLAKNSIPLGEGGSSWTVDGMLLFFKKNVSLERQLLGPGRLLGVHPAHWESTGLRMHVLP